MNGEFIGFFKNTILIGDSTFKPIAVQFEYMCIVCSAMRT